MTDQASAAAEANADHPLPGQRLVHVEHFNDYEESCQAPQWCEDDDTAANLLTSKVAGDSAFHKVVLDLDLPGQLIPSSTPGHFHLIVDHEIAWEDYETLLIALGATGLLELGYVGAALRRGFTGVRLPWVRKTAEERLATNPVDPVRYGEARRRRAKLLRDRLPMERARELLDEAKPVVDQVGGSFAKVDDPWAEPVF